MRKKLGKAMTVTAVLAVVLSVGTVSALAAERDTASCGWQTGRQQSCDRHAQFEEAAGLATDTERETFLKNAGIGEGSSYRDVQHSDAEELVDAGVIDQATADRIAEYAAQKHTGLHDWYAAKSDDLSPQDRRACFAGRQADLSGGDSVEELLEAGIITQSQAEAISGYLSK